ncbi:MAG: holo-ACP synthase [Pseudomonadales bacterium]|nr:holo-ACP synthase [Pseudomonadales bacterium]
MGEIYGIGTDIVKIDRIEQMMNRSGDKLAKRILTTTEMAEYTNSQNKVIFLAKRFAIKEAAAKAFGLGFRQGLAYCHIGLTHNETGKPLLVFEQKAAELISENAIKGHHVSLSDEVDYAVAFVVLNL